MFDFADLVKILSTYGPWGLLLMVFIYIIVKGEISFRYPRAKSRTTERGE